MDNIFASFLAIIIQRYEIFYDDKTMTMMTKSALDVQALIFETNNVDTAPKPLSALNLWWIKVTQYEYWPWCSYPCHHSKRWCLEQDVVAV